MRAHRETIGYSLDDLEGKSLALCMHKINLEKEDANPVVERPQALIQNERNDKEKVIKLVEASKYFIYILCLMG
jgi:hypothetical protein